MSFVQTIHSKQHSKSELSRMYTFCGCCPRFKSTQKRAMFTKSPITATTKNFNCKCVAITFSRSSTLAFSTAPIKSNFMSALRFFFLPLPRFTASFDEQNCWRERNRSQLVSIEMDPTQWPNGKTLLHCLWLRLSEANRKQKTKTIASTKAEEFFHLPVCWKHTQKNKTNKTSNENHASANRNSWQITIYRIVTATNYKNPKTNLRETRAHTLKQIRYIRAA